ncbi:hypothetical protein EV641_113171 [Rhodococcus sp. SMB37]|nr:hypothetical protein EV641_113171 [Rhodococcus sp. SMB37]
MDGQRVRRAAIALAAPLVVLTSMAPAASADIETTVSWSVFTKEDSVQVRFNYHEPPDRDSPYTCVASMVGATRSLDMNTVTYGAVEFTNVSEGTHTVGATCENSDGSQQSVGRILFHLPGPDHWHLARTQHAVID